MSDAEQLRQRNPFPGLRPFEQTEGDRFFGRQQQIDELLNRLGESPLVAVAGESGCGKSSLVLAGLLNALTKPGVAGGTDWRAVVMRPGGAPIAALARSLHAVMAGGASADGWREASLEGQLRLGSLALVKAVSGGQLPPAARLLIVVDQFEEVFRFARKAVDEEAAAFVKLLLQAASDPRSRVSVVLTMRTDALGACAVYRGLPEAVAAGLFLVPRMTREQRTEAIVKPVTQAGEQIAPSLVQRLLNDVSDDYDDLPLMQHVLSRTWHQWAQSGGGRPLQLVDYQAAGGAAGALSQHAEEALHSLGDRQALVQRVFRALTERTTDGQTNRRPLPFDQLCKVVAAGPEEVSVVIDRFRQADTALLLPAPPTVLAPTVVIDISHESLIRLWATLRDEWVVSEGDARKDMARLLQAARAWQADKGEPWGRRDIRHAHQWWQATQPNAAWLALTQGVEAAGNDLALAQRFLAASKRAVQRSNQKAIAIPVFCVLVAWGATQFLLDRKAHSEGLASLAMLQTDRDPSLSAHLAVAAMEVDPNNLRADHALRVAVTELDAAHAIAVQALDDGQIADARFSADRATLVVTGEKRVHLLNPRTLQKTHEPMAVEGNLVQAWLMAGNRWLLVQHTGGVVLQSLDGARPLSLACPGDDEAAYTVAVSRDQRALALGCRDGRIVRWDLGGEQPVERDAWTPPASDSSTVTAMAFSPDASLVASGSTEGSVRVWRVGLSKPVFDDKRRPRRDSQSHHTAAIRDINFGKDSTDLLLTGSDDRQAIVWQYALGAGKAEQKLRTFALPHDREVKVARFASQAVGEVALTVSGKDVRLWTDSTSTARRGHNDWAIDVDVSDDGIYIASAGADGTANVFVAANMAPVARLRGHRAGVQRALFLPASHDVLTASLDGTVRLWSVRPPTGLLTSRAKWELGVAFDPAGQRALVCGEADEQRQCAVHDLNHRDAKPLLLTTLTGGGPMSSPIWSSDGSLLLAQHQTNDVIQQANPVMWDSQSGDEVTPDWLRKNWAFAAFNPSTPHLVTIDLLGAMALWPQQALMQDVPEPQRRWPAQAGRLMAALSGDGHWLAAVNGNRVQLWRLNDDEAPSILLAPHLGTVKSVRFSRDSRLAVTASDDGTARVWRLPQPGAAPTATPNGSIEVVPFVALKGGHTGTLSAAAFGRKDGSLVATASGDNTVRIWDSKTGAMLGTLRLHGDSVNDVQFSADGESILSASDDGTVRLTRCSACTLSAQQLRERVARDLPLAPGDAEVLADMVNGSGGWWDRLLAWTRKR